MKIWRQVTDRMFKRLTGRNRILVGRDFQISNEMVDVGVQAMLPYYGIDYYEGLQVRKLVGDVIFAALQTQVAV